ncbi:MAG: aminotransferase class V-fold PLP-dependent enzyme [Phycisphaerae bacterium]|jgi:cysteine desulfurase
MNAPPLTYLDNNATTRVDPRVVDALVPLLAEQYGNPSSAHHFGAQVAVQIEQSRRQVAALIGARDAEIVFTCGGTEADNTALRGVLTALPEKRHVIISPVEHHAIFETCERLEEGGLTVTRLRVDREGRLDLDHLASSLRDDTALVSVMLANNETGVVFPLRQISEIAHARGVLVHTDAVNATGKLAYDVNELGVDLLSLSAHKFHGPKGVGALYIRRGTPFRSVQIGGAQERGRRGGTLNAPGIVALGAACALLSELGDAVHERMRVLRDQLETRLRERLPDVYICGSGVERLPNTTCACFPGVSSEAILMLLSEAGICVSTGSACASGTLDPSHVLVAMGIDPHVAQGQIRFSLGRFNTKADIDRLFEVLPNIVARAATSNV